MNTIPNFDIKKLPSQARQLTALFYHMGYHFGDINLPLLALMHRSYDSEHNYERLEFLGDALLGVIIAEALFERYPTHNEGQLTRMRATLVRESTLAIIAKNLQLSEFLILGVGERKGGGRHRVSILADTVEALIGAIYLYSDFNTVKQCVLKWYENVFELVEEQNVLKDAKSRLQELLQAHQFALPKYDLLKTEGTAPNQLFTVKCTVAYTLKEKTIIEQIIAQGESRRIAEQRSAESMLTNISDNLPKLK